MGLGLLSAGSNFYRPLLDPAAQETAMVQKETQQVKGPAVELAPQHEVVAQPRVQVLDQGVAVLTPRRLRRHGTGCPSWFCRIVEPDTDFPVLSMTPAYTGWTCLANA